MAVVVEGRHTPVWVSPGSQERVVPGVFGEVLLKPGVLRQVSPRASRQVVLLLQLGRKVRVEVPTPLVSLWVTVRYQYAVRSTGWALRLVEGPPSTTSL